jgi:uncharacterized protein
MLLDTSGLLCVHHRGEMQHGDAQTLFRAAPLRLTHSYVLAEFIALAQVRRLDRAAALAFVSELQDNPLIQVIWVDELLHRAAIELLHRQLDKTYSLCDAISFLIMHERGLVEALTTDRHFEQAGFRRLLAGA